MIRLADELEQQVKGWRATSVLATNLAKSSISSKIKLSVYSKKTNA
ncbi:hypothetical protein OQG70_04950 [Streptococcus macedonicus]|nr:hypothetical protein [Streptococcus macedonicus]MCW8644615.1 hypothetical protein [Streptococcus macedonicus]